MDKHVVIIEAEFHLERLDKVLSQVFDDYSRTQLQQMMKDSHILVNGVKVKSNYKAKENDKVEIEFQNTAEVDILAEDLNLDIIYEDSDLLVVYKPEGMVVHPAVGHGTGTLVNGLMHHCTDLSGINGELRPGIVHRIDKDTSGLLVVAKNDFAHKGLAKQLEEKTMTRKYEAIVYGVIPHEKGTIDAPIGRDEKDRKKMAVTAKNSKHAITHFKVLERFEKFTHIECQLETGRTHQIRVHMKYIEHQLVGDITYGPRKVIGKHGQMLHAKTLGFVHPRSDEYLEFSCEAPSYFKEFLEMVRGELDE